MPQPRIFTQYIHIYIYTYTHTYKHAHTTNKHTNVCTAGHKNMQGKETRYESSTMCWRSESLGLLWKIALFCRAVLQKKLRNLSFLQNFANSYTLQLFSSKYLRMCGTLHIRIRALYCICVQCECINLITDFQACIACTPHYCYDYYHAYM